LSGILSPGLSKIAKSASEQITDIPTSEDISESAAEYEALPASVEEMLASHSQSRPSFPFTTDHVEHERKRLKIVHPSHFRVPVPIGPALPREDRPEEVERSEV